MCEIHLKEKPSQLHYLADNWYRNMFFCVTSSKLRDTKCQILGRAMFRVKEISECQFTQGKFHGNTHPAWFIRCIHVFFLVGKVDFLMFREVVRFGWHFSLLILDKWYQAQVHWVFKVGGIRLNWHSPGLEILFPSFFHSWPFNHPNGGHVFSPGKVP